MKKTIVLVIIIGMLALTGCYAAYVDETQNRDTNVINDTTGNTADVETNIDKLNDEDNHFTVKTGGKLLIDADVTEYGKYNGKKFGLYYIEKYEFPEEDKELFYNYVIEKYGDDVIITPDEAAAAMKEDPDVTVICNVFSQEQYLRFTLDTSEIPHSPLLGSMEFFSVWCPIWEKNIDMNVVGAALDESYEIINRLADISEYDLKRCIHTDEIWRSKAESLGVLQLYDSKEYYAIRHIQTCEGIPIVTNSNRHFNEVRETYSIRLDNCLDVYLDSRGNLMEYEYSKCFDIKGEAFEHIDVISAKEVVKKIYDKYKNTHVKMEFYDIELVYSGDLKKDDTGKFKEYIRPYWIARYVGTAWNDPNNSDVTRCLIIDGQSGDVVYGG